MLNKFKISFVILLLILSAQINSVFATHIVGGDVTYKCLGSTTQGIRYAITVEIYQDCINGIPEARAEDIPAIVGIFSYDGKYKLIDSIPSFRGGVVDSEFVKPNFSNECVNNPPKLCLKRLRFTKEFVLPFNSSGYKVIYIRCCRNEAILNLNNPGQVGATYFCNIPSSAEVSCNSSAYFKEYPPQIICINNPLVYDHSAIDVDGDSLSYELCDAYPGGMTTSPKPFPTGAIPSPLRIVNNAPPSFGYKPGFTPQKPMGGNPLIQIDPKTGLITGTPNLQGRFVVAVCVNEWRNGVIINTSSREFQFTVTNCSKAVVADIPQFSDEYNTYVVSCKSKTVKFINKSTGGFNYRWSFGTNDFSSDFEPTYTYPDTGVYEVELFVNQGSTCPDSITRLVKIYPDYETKFKDEGLKCPNAPIQFTDLSEATFKPVIKWDWNFGDGQTSEDQNPTHSYVEGGEYNVTLVSSSIKGCRDSLTQKVVVENFQPFAGNDTIIVKGETVEFNASGGTIYEWTPFRNLNTASAFNPRGYYPDTGMYRYNVYIKSPIGCEGNDSINVWVVSQPSLFIPTGFTPNGDGKNDLLRPLSVGYSAYKHFRVFNRWGELVFQTDRIGEGWDGNYKGKKSDVGTYFWSLLAEDKDGQLFERKGDATLIR